MAGSNALRYGVPFPVRHQERFHTGMVAIIQNLPRLNRTGKISN
jgi:hypothetical protein